MLWKAHVVDARAEWTPIASLGSVMFARSWQSKSSASSATRPDFISPQKIPIVLVAGLGMSSRYWVRFARRLSDQLGESFQVLAPDLPGFGRSPEPPQAPWPGGPTVREQADQLLAWMDARGIRRAVLCGHSTGCQTVVDLAWRFPTRVEKLVLAAPTFEPGHRTLLQYIPRLLLDAAFELPSLRLLAVYEYALNGLPRVLQQAHRMIADPMESKLESIEIETLVVAGQFDTMVSKRWSQQVAQLLPHASMVVIDRAGHGMHHSAAAVMATVVHDFLIERSKAENGGGVIAPKDDPRRDALGPPQPISPALHGCVDYLLAGAMLLATSTEWVDFGPRTRRTLQAAALISTINNLFTDHPTAAVRSLPMATHANVDIVNGSHLLLAAFTYLRKENRVGKWWAVAIGCFHLASATLTAKPTGPARVCPIARRIELRV